jgi:hypothetical protein
MREEKVKDHMIIVLALRLALLANRWQIKKQKPNYSAVSI